MKTIIHSTEDRTDSVCLTYDLIQMTTKKKRIKKVRLKDSERHRNYKNLEDNCRTKL